MLVTVNGNLVSVFFQTEHCINNIQCFLVLFILLMFPGKISLLLLFFFLHLWFNKWRVTFCKRMLVPTLTFLCHLRIIWFDLFTTVVYKISLEAFWREMEVQGEMKELYWLLSSKWNRFDSTSHDVFGSLLCNKKPTWI